MRNIAETNFLANHSQSNKSKNPVFDMASPDEAAFAYRALNLPHLRVAVLPGRVEEAARRHYEQVLGLRMPQIVVPQGVAQEANLSVALKKDRRAHKQIRALQQQGMGQLIYSAFEPMQDDVDAFEALIDSGVDLISEVRNVKAAEKLGNKAEFRKICEQYGIPQAFGAVVTSVDQLKHIFSTIRGAVAIKHPLGTAGVGIDFVDTCQGMSDRMYEKWGNWIADAGALVVEEKVSGDEYNLHLYRDPMTGKAKVEGIYRQLVSKTTDEEGVEHFSHFGSRSPVENTSVEQLLTELTEARIRPMAEALDLTGPIIFDLIHNPLLPEAFHFMEGGLKTGANRYAQKLKMRVGRSLFGEIDPTKVSSLFLAGVDHNETSFEDFLKAYGDVLMPSKTGVLVPMNLGRYRFGKTDLLAVSVSGQVEADKIMRQGLVKIKGGEAEAEKIWSSIVNLEQSTASQAPLPRRGSIYLG